MEPETPGAEEGTPAGEEQPGGAPPEGSTPKDQPKYTYPDNESVPEKFRGKSPEDVLKSYTELEKMVDRKAESLVEQRLSELGISLTKKEKKDVVEQVQDLDLSKIDFSKMRPDEFAKWIIGEVDKRAEAKARHIVQQTSSTQEQVRQEIAAAQAKHPQLKDNQEYREAVLSFVENASARGEKLTLEDACQKVDRLMGVKPVEQGKTPDGKGVTPSTEGEAQIPEKKPVDRAGVEGAPAAPDGNNLTEDEKVLQGIANAGGHSSGPLGGLGI